MLPMWQGDDFHTSVVIELQSAKANGSIFLSDFGIVMVSCIMMHPLKALNPIRSSPSGNVTCVSLLQLWNAQESTPTTR
jgi:hypothetical protein